MLMGTNNKNDMVDTVYHFVKVKTKDKDDSE